MNRYNGESKEQGIRMDCWERKGEWKERKKEGSMVAYHQRLNRKNKAYRNE